MHTNDYDQFELNAELNP